MFIPIQVAAAAPAAAHEPIVYILAIGVGTWRAAGLPALPYAPKDASDFISAMQAAGARAGVHVEPLLLSEEQATRHAILAALESLRVRSRAQDVVIVFLAGHGINQTGTDVYYFIPFDFLEDQCLASGVQGSMLCHELIRMKGRRLLIVDTCNAGNILDDRMVRFRGSSREPKALLNTLSAAPSDGKIALLAAAGAHEPSMEGRQWENGAFTRALIEAIGGRAAPKSGELSVRALAAYTSKRVRELTCGSQRPVFVCLGKAADFEILPTAPGARPKSAADLLGTLVSTYRIVKVVEDTEPYQLYAAEATTGPSSGGVQVQIFAPASPLGLRGLQAALERARELTSARLATILEYGQLADGRAFVVVLPQAGRRLDRLLAESVGPLPQAPVVLLGVLRALRALCRAGLLYLDLRPERILFDPQTETVELCVPHTLCLAAEARRGSAAQTAEYDSQGPDEIVPLCEQTDAFAVGILAGRLLLGGQPTSHGIRAALAAAARSADKPADGRSASPGWLPPQLAALLQRALSPEPAQRPSLAALWLIGEAALRKEPAVSALPAARAITKPPRIPSVEKELRPGGGAPSIFWMLLGLVLFFSTALAAMTFHFL